MGQTTSSTGGSLGPRRKSIRHSLRSPFSKRSRASLSASSLSAACNFIDIDRKFDQLNINTASEEELMTLPGINRFTAHTIVEYRQAIGRFKKVEDLALVSGIGAEKLDAIRPEICVNRRKNASGSSSRAQSTDSLLNEGARGSARGSPHARPVNVNTANVFDLMAVHGLNQELAANVVHHRDRRGPFKSVDDLIKVKGINQWRLGTVRGQVSVEEFEAEAAPANKSWTLPAPPALSPDATKKNTLQVPNGKITGHRKTMSVPIKYVPLTNGLLPNKDIFELLSAYSQRPIVEEDFYNQRNGRPALRLATWNLHDFSSEKADNPGVRETLCRTILENSFSLIAVQEVIDNFALIKLCSELNQPQLRRVADWKDDECDWQYAAAAGTAAAGTAEGARDGLAFLYDASAEVKLVSADSIALSAAGSTVVLLARFQLEDTTVCLANVHASGCVDLSFEAVHSSLKKHVREGEKIIMLGDFSAMDRNIAEKDSEEFIGLVPESSCTSSCLGYQEERYFDNIYLSSRVKSLYTGMWGVVRQGLSHLAIPRGWSWGGPASEHCPVWCELYTGPLPPPPPSTAPNGTAKAVE